MIRSNPTAIPLRPSDVKALQVELERRRQREQPETQSQRTERGADESDQSVTERAPRQVMTQAPRDTRSVQERIGL